MKRLYILVGVLCGCSTDTSPAHPWQNLQGTWVDSDATHPTDSLFYSLSFRADSARILPGGSWEPFATRGDTLRIGSADRPSALWHITSLTQDTIHARAVHDPTEEPFAFTLLNTQLLRDTTIQLGRIRLTGGWCFGECPRFSLEIDSTGRMIYEGRRYAPLQGKHQRPDTTGAWQRLEHLVQVLDPDRLPEPGAMPDAWSIGLVIEYSGRRRVFYGSSNLMGPADMLVEELLDVVREQFWKGVSPVEQEHERS